MLMPSIYERNFIENFFEDFAKPARNFVKHSSIPTGTMRTDIKENEKEFEITMDLPGFKKENVKAELDEGYLTITASTASKAENKAEDNAEANAEGTAEEKTASKGESKGPESRFIRKERFYGECKRSFYVGEEVEPEDIKAKFEDGLLILNIPKKAPQPEVKKNTFIRIAG